MPHLFQYFFHPAITNDKALWMGGAGGGGGGGAETETQREHLEVYIKHHECWFSFNSQSAIVTRNSQKMSD